MSGRRAPTGGYDFGNKRQYRRDVWGGVRWFLGDTDNLTALILPSIEGDEIEIALASGVRSSNLHIVDRNPAIVATLKRRYPGVHTYGVDLFRAMDRMERLGVCCNFVNADLCGPASATTEKLGVVCPRVVGRGGLVAVTWLRGRESGKYRPSALTQTPLVVWATESIGVAHIRGYEPNHGDAGRIAWFVGAMPCAWAVRVLRVGSYRSGSQTMLWALLALYFQPEVAHWWDYATSIGWENEGLILDGTMGRKHLGKIHDPLDPRIERLAFDRAWDTLTDRHIFCGDRMLYRHSATLKMRIDKHTITNDWKWLARESGFWLTGDTTPIMEAS